MEKILKQLFLIKIGEINLKGGNRRLFEKKLVNNIKKQLGNINVKITGRAGRFYLEYISKPPGAFRACGKLYINNHLVLEGF